MIIIIIIIIIIMKHKTNNKSANRTSGIVSIVCGRSKLSKREYKNRHDTLASVVHWELLKYADD